MLCSFTIISILKNTLKIYLNQANKTTINKKEENHESENGRNT